MVNTNKKGEIFWKLIIYYFIKQDNWVDANKFAQPWHVCKSKYYNEEIQSLYHEPLTDEFTGEWRWLSIKKEFKN